MTEALQTYLPFLSNIIYNYLSKTYINKKLSECTGQLIGLDQEQLCCITVTMYY